jgi:hypothetical protein
VTILIGHNDICLHSCRNSRNSSSEYNVAFSSANNYVANVKEALDYLKDRIGRRTI